MNKWFADLVFDIAEEFTATPQSTLEEVAIILKKDRPDEPILALYVEEDDGEAYLDEYPYQEIMEYIDPKDILWLLANIVCKNLDDISPEKGDIK